MRGAGSDVAAEAPDARAVVEAVEALPVIVEGITVAVASRAVAGYGSEGRPTAVVRVVGGGSCGLGESVAWTLDDQARFAGRCPGLVPHGQHRLGELARRLEASVEDRYERAAVEAALVDLALRQRGTNLFRLASRIPQPVTFVLSFGTLSDPAAELRALLAAAPGARVKVDVDPSWPDSVFADLAALEAVAVLDFKLRGDRRLVERAHARLPSALLEDPRLEPEAVEPTFAGRVSFDAPIGRAADIARLPLQPAAVNVKPARMGGFLEALRAIAACQRAGLATYVGGMFEVGPGRKQVQVLASLFSPGAWNDVAPIPASAAGPWPASPLLLPERFSGLGHP